MKRFALFFAFLVFVGLPMLQAQTVQITGKITSSEDGNPIPGVSVIVKGTTIGTTTDFDGKYTLNVPSNSASLVFSFVGLKTQEVAIGGRNTVDVTMETDVVGLEEVVVTALGISKQKKALGYSVQDVKGEEMSKTRGGINNPINALTGKVAGLQITGASGQIGGSSKILIRGVKSLSGNNQPLFVIDGVPIEGTDYNTTDAARGAGGYDYGNLIQDINPDDIESISVLKGPNASALYGSRATNGVVMITTKKGEKNKGLGVAFNTSIGFERVNKLPKMQKEYGGGYDFTDETINGVSYQAVDYGTDESWGPKFEGQPVLQWYDLAKWEAGGKVGNPTTSPWVAPKHDIDDFFETGYTLSNNIALSGGTENTTFRASYTNTTQDGYMPNSSLDKNVLSINGSTKGGKLYELFTSVNYVNQKTKGRPETGYGDNNVMQKFIQWGQRSIDMEQLKDLYQFPDGTQATWNRVAWDDPTPNYSNNPYWSRYMNYQNDTRDRLYGNVGVKLNLMSNLKFQYKLNLDYFSDKQYERNAVGSQEQSRYFELQRQQHEINHEFLLMFSQGFGDINIDANLGSNLMNQKYERIQGTSVGGLILPEFYNLSNSKFQPKSENYSKEKSINSVFGNVTFGYKSLAFLDVTLRNDWSSTLPSSDRSYIYPSVTGSLVFSELMDSPWLSFGKFRLGWAQVGSDTDPYRVEDTYKFYTSVAGEHAYNLPTTKNNSGLKPEITTSYEAGLEMSFFQNRLSFDLTAYYGETKNQIISLALSGTTGYNNKIINAGLISNQGVELQLKGSPVKTADFEWTVTGTVSSNKNKVKELVGLTDYLKLATAPFKVEVGVFKGEEYGVIMGTDFVYDANGNKVVDANGLYTYTSGNVSLGSVYPDVLAGLTNAFRYKNIDLSILFDSQFGGKFFSTSHMWGMYSGMLEETAGLNELGNPKRDDPADGGGVLLEGVHADGTPNTTRVDAETWAGSYYSGAAAYNVFKSDFIKLREITIGYTFPLKSTTIIKGLRVSAYGRNLALWGPDTKHFDPESATTNSGNVQGIEGGALPSLVNFGLNVGIQF